MSENNTDSPTTEQRCEWARLALDNHIGNKGADDAEADIVDLVADLLHFAKSNEIDTDYVLRMAKVHFEEEDADVN